MTLESLNLTLLKMRIRHFIWIMSLKIASTITSLVAEAVIQVCSVKNVFLENLQNSQENTPVRISFLIKSQA